MSEIKGIISGRRSAGKAPCICLVLALAAGLLSCGKGTGGNGGVEPVAVPIRIATTVTTTETRTAIVETKRPATETDRPAAEMNESAAKTNGPAAKANRSATETKRPAAETNGNVVGTKRPAAETDKPAAESDRPTAEKNRSASETDKPAAETNRHVVETNNPTEETDRPAAETERPATRATEQAFENGDEVGVFVVNQPKSLQVSGNHLDNGRFTFDGTGWSSDKETYWLDGTTKGDFYCYYPYSSTVLSVNDYQFLVSTDQSGESGYKASDFLWGKVTGVRPTPDPVMITVNHRMSGLTVKLKAGTGWKEGEIRNADVMLRGLMTAAKVNLASGEVTAEGAASDIKPYAVGDGIFKALVPPQTVAGAELVRIDILGNSYSLKTSIDLKSGRQYTCTVVVNRTGEGINIGIGPWETDDTDYGGSAE